MTCEHESRKSQPGSRGIYHASIILVQVLNDVSVGLLGPETVARKRMVWFVASQLSWALSGSSAKHLESPETCLGLRMAVNVVAVAMHTMAGSRCLSSLRDAIPILVYSTDQEIFMLWPLGSTVLRIDFPTWQLPSSRWMLIRPFLPL